MDKSITYKIINLYGSFEKKESVASFRNVKIFEPFIEFNEDEIVLIDGKFNIKYVNKSFSENFFPDKNNEANERNLKNYFSSDVIEKIAFVLETIHKSDIKIYKFGFVHEESNNESLSYCVKVYKTNSADGETLFILAFHNKTQEKGLLVKYLYAKQEAENSRLAKDIFLSQISHEIRTPLNKIMSYSGLLRAELEDSLSVDMQDTFKVIEKASMRLVRTLDLLINLSEIQANAYKCQFGEIDLIGSVIDPMIDEHKKIADEKGLTIEKKFEKKKIYVTGDLYSVSKIFGQILDNAIKYTEKGGVVISLEKDSRGNVILKVTDSGIGISEEYLPHIFDTFSQEEMGYTRKYDGNGIGLTIVKKYCELNNIGISVTSKKGSGTTFTLTFKAKREYPLFVND